MRSVRSMGRRGRTSLIGLAVVGLAVAGCTTADDGGDASVGEGVAFGASIEEYRAAFADVDPITLRFQIESPENSLNAVGRQSYGDALEEWSGGKIAIEWGYSASFVPNALEWSAGLADGRMDIGFFLPYYTPEIFPTLSDLTTATLLDGNLPTSTLVSTGWITDAVYSLPGYLEEAEEGGVHILSLTPSANIPVIFCKQDRTSLADFEGVPVSASGSGRVAQLSALGFNPQSIAFTELYEALERNVVECGSTVVTNLDTIGATELTPYIVADPVASLVGFPNFLAISQDTWESLPLVAQQLMIDRLDVLLENEPVSQSQRNARILEQVTAAGGGMKPFADDARAALLEVNEGLLEELGTNGADIEAILGLHEQWNDLVNDELLPDLSPSIEEFLRGGAFDGVDLQSWIDAVFAEVLVPNRPS